MCKRNQVLPFPSAAERSPAPLLPFHSAKPHGATEKLLGHLLVPVYLEDTEYRQRSAFWSHF